jgi:uncharacterized protein
LTAHDRIAELVRNCTGFDWDAGNKTKSLDKHGVSVTEAEHSFFNIPLLFSTARNSREERFSVHGKTDVGRKLFVVFTIRGTLLRVISARPMHEIERKAYHEQGH